MALQNTIDVDTTQAGSIEPEQIRGLELNLLVDTGVAMLCLPSQMKK